EQVSVSFPPRSYDLLGSILVDAIDSEGPGERARDSVVRAAARTGRELGKTASKSKGSGVDRALRVLTENGFEPYLTGDRVALRNCPFHDLAQRSRELVCGINQSFATGLLEGLKTADLEAVLDPTPGECCVKLQPRTN
ncbi:MAG: hypothetical protein QOH90_729, partial [Actinomycetota bacterium]|nr:hypothetical protein [Actinomycetota bacterium]